MNAFRIFRVVLVWSVNFVLVIFLGKVIGRTSESGEKPFVPKYVEATMVPALRANPVQATITMKVTAYCLCEKCCGSWAIPTSSKGGRVTSIGDDATVMDGVAADPKLIPYRTKLSIPGIGIREVDDTGGAMRQSAKRGIFHIDVRFPTHDEARQWGVQWLEVTIISNTKS